MDDFVVLVYSFRVIVLFSLYKTFLFPGRFIHNILGNYSIIPIDLKKKLSTNKSGYLQIA